MNIYFCFGKNIFFPVQNIRCHNGKKDKTGHWCECDRGWVSAPFDQKFFNPDIQVYHMCTVWTGKITAEEARKITVLPKSPYENTNILIVSFDLLFIFYICNVIISLFVQIQGNPKGYLIKFKT